MKTAVIKTPAQESSLAFWDRQTSEGDWGIPARSSVSRSDRKNNYLSLSKGLTERGLTSLLKYSGGRDLEIFVLGLTALNTLLYKYYKGRSILHVPTPCSIDQLGHGNCLPVIFKGAPGMSLKDALLATNEIFINSFKHGNAIGDFKSRLPVKSLQFLFRMDQATMPIENREEINFDLIIDIVRKADSISVHATYSKEEFETSFVERFLGHFVNILDAFHDLSARLDQVQYLSAQEQNQLTRGFNNKSRNLDHSSVVTKFEEIVKMYHNEKAIITQKQVISYGELNDYSDRLAHYLLSRPQLKKGSVVCVMIEKSANTIISLLATLKAGMVYVPVNPELPQKRIMEILSDAAAGAVILESGSIFNIEYFKGEIFSIDLQLNDLPAVANKSGWPLLSADDPAYIVFTSGSTGIPKGVCISHVGLFNVAIDHVIEFNMQASDVYCLFMDTSFDGSLLDVFTTLLAGSALFVPSKEDIRNPEEFTKSLIKFSVSVVTMTPSYLNILEREALAKIRIIVSAGESAIMEDARWYSSVKDFYNGYGPTEVSVNTTLCKVTPDRLENSVPIGSPSTNKQVYILDTEGELLPIGVPGELYIAGIGVASGYLNDPDFTQSKFVNNPFSGSATMYRSGDRGIWTEEGEIVFLGRIDNQLKINGFRIDTTEIERVMLSHRFVRNACIAVDDNGREKQLVAFVEFRNELELVPSLGEYGVYDSFIYKAMASDPMRVSGYRTALTGNVVGQVGIDLGAGPQAPLARHSIDAGAEKVYAVEVDADTATKAKEFLDRSGLADKVLVINNDIRDLQLPDKPDFCVSALAGNIASSDGCITLINGARPVLPKGIRFFPSKYHTLIAAVDFSKLPLQNGLDEIYSHYAEEIFKQEGSVFDLRLCVKNFDQRHLISTSAICETIDYEGDLKPDDETAVSLRVIKAGVFDGVLCWLNAISGGRIIIDSIEKTHHLPVFIPLTMPVNVSVNDSVELVFKRQVSSDGLHPDYIITGSVSTQDGRTSFEAATYHHSKKLMRSNKYHRAIINEKGKINVIERPSERAIHEYLKESLPVYMMPSAIVNVDEIPLTIVQKIDKQKLLEIFHEKSINGVNYVRPVTKLEQLCAEIWQSVLNKEQIGLTDDFFYHGGDSIKVIQVASRLRVHGFQAEVRDLFEKSILADFVAALYPVNQAISEEVVSGTYPPTTVQREIFGRKRPQPNHYNQAIMVRCEERVDEKMLITVFRKLFQHHDALRTVVSFHAGMPEPSIQSEMDVVLDTFDYRGGKEQVPRTKLDELQSGIDTDKGPLLRLALFKMDDVDQLLIYSHHFIIDSVSWMILMQDIITLINKFSSGQELILPPKTTSFKSWAQTLDEYGRSASAGNNLKYWQDLLAKDYDVIPVIKGAKKLYSKSTTISVSLNSADSENLTRKANKAFKSHTNELVIAGLGVALKNQLGMNEVLLMMESHGRGDNFSGVDVTRTVGWFTSFYPLPLACGTIDREGEYIMNVCNTVRGIPNLGIDYGILSTVSALGSHRNKIQIGFNFLGELDEIFSDRRFKTIRSSLGALQGDQWEREFDLDVSGMVANGKLSINFTFNEQQISKQVIDRLAAGFKDALSEIIDAAGTYDQAIVPVAGMVYNKLSESDLKSLFD